MLADAPRSPWVGQRDPPSGGREARNRGLAHVGAAGLAGSMRAHGLGCWEMSFQGLVLHRFGMALVLAGSACGQDSEHDDRTETSAQSTADIDGVVCLSPTRNAGVAVDVVFWMCLGCGTAEAKCTTRLDGDRAVVTGQLTVTSPPSPDIVCADDCGPARVRCGAILPDTSSVRFVQGSLESDPVVVPLAGDTQLFGTDAPGACENQPQYFEGY